MTDHSAILCRLLGGVLLASGWALASAPALAATTTSTSMTVSAAIPNSCTASTTGNMAFGTLAASLTVSANVDTTGTLSVTCLNGGTYTVIADNGQNVSSGQRRMTKNGSSGPFLNYNIYADSGRSTAFPTAVGSATTQTGSGSAQTITVYGRIPANATATEAGAYSDTLGFTITY